MNNVKITWIVVLITGSFLLSMYSHPAAAKAYGLYLIDQQPSIEAQAAQTPYPANQPDSSDNETPEARVLPPVGGNAGLVISASVLVLIIIVGIIISSRMKAKH